MAVQTVPNYVFSSAVITDNSLLHKFQLSLHRFVQQADSCHQLNLTNVLVVSSYTTITTR